jgi:hypothetical protein
LCRVFHLTRAVLFLLPGASPKISIWGYTTYIEGSVQHVISSDCIFIYPQTSSVLRTTNRVSEKSEVLLGSVRLRDAFLYCCNRRLSFLWSFQDLSCCVLSRRLLLISRWYGRIGHDQYIVGRFRLAGLIRHSEGR